MNIFQRMFHRKSEDRLAGSGYRFLFGPSTAGKTVTEQTAMQLSTVFACVRVLAESVASLPLHVYEKGEDGNQTRAEGTNLYHLLHDAPNPEMTSYTFRETEMVHLLLFGNSFAQVLRNGRGEVLGLYPLLPNHMTVERDEDGQLFYRYMRNNQEPPESKDTTVILYPDEVLHIPGLSMDGLIGMSPIAACRNVIGSGLAADEYSGRYFANGAAPSGVLTTPGVLKDPKKLRDSWNEVYGGTRNSGRVAVLEEGVQYTPISVSPQDAQLLETRKFTVEEICRIFRVPPHLVQDLDRATFSNIEEQSLDFVKFSLMPYLTRWEQGLTRTLLSPKDQKKYVIKFNIDAFLRGDYKSRMEGYATAINNGFLSPNDVRRLEGWDLIPDEEGGNQFLVQGAMVPLKRAGAAYENKNSASGLTTNGEKAGGADNDVNQTEGGGENEK